MERSTLVVSSVIRQHKHYHSWLDFHKKNRHIIRMIIKEMDALIASGKKHVSIKHIMIVIRHKTSITLVGDYPYKINDAYTSIYAHVIADTFPVYDKYIERRQLKSTLAH